MRIILLFTILSTVALNTEKKCKDSFIGKWKYDNYDIEYIYVERTLEKQLEYMNNGKFYYEFDIEWLSECEYELTYVGTNSSNQAAAYIGEKFKIEILKINDSLTEYKTVFRGLEDIGTMSRLKQ